MKERLFFWLMPRLIHWTVAFIGATLRIKAFGIEHYESVKQREGGFIYALWHGRMFMPVYTQRHKGICVLVSQHSDGELIARVLLRFGCQVVRGSTTRGGRRALIEMLRKARRGTTFAFTPDGPKGPLFKVQPGVIFLAQRSGMPILPITGSATRKKVLDSWDRFLLPMPFSKASLVFGEPLFVNQELTEAALKAMSEELEKRMNAATALADALCEG